MRVWDWHLIKSIVLKLVCIELRLDRVDRANPKPVPLGPPIDSGDWFGTELTESRLDSVGSAPNRSTRPSQDLFKCY
jgi:hypothetical protein